MIRSHAVSQFETGPAHMIGVPSMNRMSPVNTTPASGTWAIVSPRVCAGPSSSRWTSRSPTRSSCRPSNDSVGSRSLTEAKSNLRIARSANASNSGPEVELVEQHVDGRGRRGAHVLDRAALATIGMPSGSSSLPNQWSPLPWVLNA